MNIIDVQDQLKDFSEQQLITEMQRPSGTAPQFLVLSEIQRRKRMRDDFARREAAQQKTVAQEAVASAGVPQAGVAGMSGAMAPKSAAAEGGIGSVMPQSMRPQTMPAPTDDAIPMRSGGLAQFGQEIQMGLAQKTRNEQIEPFLDEVEQMAQSEFGLESNLMGSGIRPMPNFPNQGFPPNRGFPTPPVRGGPFGGGRMGGKGGGMSGIHLARQLQPIAIPEAMNPDPSPVQKYDEGGVIRANIGAFFNADGTPTEAGIRALIGQESGGDPTARGSVDELGLTQIRPGTAIMPGYGVQSMFPNIASLIGPGKKYDTNNMKMAEAVQKAYEDNRELIDAGLIDPDRATAFSRDYLRAMSEKFPDDPNRALAAYNIGPDAAAKLENPAEFGYVTSVLGRMGSDSAADEPGIIETALDAAGDFAGDVVGGIFGTGTAYAQGAQAPATSSSTSAPAAPVVQEPPKALPAERKEMILGMIRAGKSNPALLGIQARGFLEDPAVAADPDIIAALREAGIEPASTARVVTKPITVEQDVTLPSGKVVEAGETLDVGDILDFQTAEFIGALDDTEGTGGTVGSIDSQSAAEDEMINDYLLGRLTDDGQPTGFKPMITEEGLESLAIPPGALSAEGDETVTTEESDGGSEESDTEKDDGTNKEPKKGDDSNVELFGGETAVSSIEAEIAKLKANLEKGRESDKWLALAQAGLALMSSKEPTLLGAAGEAGISGLSAFREAQERYQEGIIDLVNAEAKLRDKKGGMTAASGVSRLNAIEKMLNPTDVTEITPLDDETRTRLEEEARYIRRNILGYKDIVA